MRWGASLRGNTPEAWVLGANIVQFGMRRWRCLHDTQAEVSTGHPSVAEGHSRKEGELRPQWGEAPIQGLRLLILFTQRAFSKLLLGASV